MDPSKELVTIVDEHNTEINQMSRAAMRAGNFIHRATYILVFNSLGELFVQKRTATKDIYPSHYEIAAGGVVLAGESYELSAQRELQEEMGIENVALHHLFDHFYDDSNNRVWGRIYTIAYDGPMILQEEEVENGSFMKIKDLLAMIETHPFCPDGIVILHRVLAVLENKEP